MHEIILSKVLIYFIDMMRELTCGILLHSHVLSVVRDLTGCFGFCGMRWRWQFIRPWCGRCDSCQGIWNDQGMASMFCWRKARDTWTVCCFALSDWKIKSVSYWGRKKTKLKPIAFGVFILSLSEDWTKLAPNAKWRTTTATLNTK